VRASPKKTRVPAATTIEVKERQNALRKALRRFDLRLSPSRFLAQEGHKQGIESIQILPHGVNASPTQREPTYFLFLGSLAFHKGPQVVAEAWKKARAKNCDLPSLRIVGPPVESECVAILPKKAVFPAIPATEVPDCLSGAHALVLGSIWPENAPLVILEALANGCPVIAPAIGGIPELVKDAQNGWLYPPGDPSALADRLLRWQELSTLKVQRPPSFDQHMQALLQHYDALLAGRQ
jgi:glycosyltransferase involved in cell wall biosynthesis